MNDQIRIKYRNGKTRLQLVRMMIYAKRAERSKRRGFERERAVRDLRRCNVFAKHVIAEDKFDRRLHNTFLHMVTHSKWVL